MYEQIDTNLYSRQIGTLGMETIKKLIELKVVIVGLRGLRIETTKNIILAGPNRLSIYEPELSNINDMALIFIL